jgi:hypothetical protein
VSELLSFGGGVNSVALTILLVNEGWRGPVVFSDTGCEMPETYCYLDYFEQEWLTPRGLEITRLGGEWREPAFALPLIDYCESLAIVPFPAVRWCTVHYKVEPLHRYAEEHGITVQHLGISADESQRKPEASRPLVDRWINRQGCVDIIQAEGLEVPGKSSCFMCPFQRDEQWRELWRLHPDLFERAARLEEAATEKRGGRVVTLDYNGKTTLRDRQYSYEHQGSLLDDAAWDELLAYKPCVCGL